MKFLILIIVCLLPSIVVAESTKTLDIAFRSHHFKTKCYSNCTKTFNEANYGLSLTVSTKWGGDVSAGFIKNSFSKTSLYGFYNFNRVYGYGNGVYVKPGFAIGIANGYKETPVETNLSKSGYVPIISPNVSIFVDNFHFNVGILPSVNQPVAVLRAGVRF